MCIADSVTSYRQKDETGRLFAAGCITNFTQTGSASKDTVSPSQDDTFYPLKPAPVDRAPPAGRQRQASAN